MLNVSKKLWSELFLSNGYLLMQILAKAANEQQAASIGNQTGGRVFLFLFTDDFWRDYNNMLEKGIHFVRPPKQEPYGLVAVFEDLYGNMWDLLQPNESNKGLK